MIRAGITQKIAKELTGHKSDVVFGRYDITSDADRLDAVYRLDEYMSRSQVPEPVEAQA